jgi:AcrR family transcriptional regulator
MVALEDKNTLRDYVPFPALVEQRGPGRPRNESHDKKIVEAVFAELAERPYSKMSVDAVATRAGLAKTTLYRRFPSKLDLVKAAIDHYFATHFFALRDCHAVDLIINSLDQQVHEFANTSAGKAMANLASESLGNPELFALLHYDDKREELRSALQAAIDRKELKPDTDIEVLIDVLLAVFPYRLIVLQKPFPDDFARRLARLVLDGCRNEVAVEGVS